MSEQLILLRQSFAGSNLVSTMDIIAALDLPAADWTIVVECMYYTGQYNEALVKINEHCGTYIQAETKIFNGKISQLFPNNYGHFLKLAADILFNAVEYRAALLIYSYLADKMILFDPCIKRTVTSSYIAQLKQHCY